MFLKDFYLSTVNKNETFKGGWAPLYYGVVSKIINDNSYKSYCEVGIGYGTHVKYVLKTTNLDKLYLVDPMKYYENDGFPNDIINKISSNPTTNDNKIDNFEELYNLILNYISEYKSKITWFRKESLNITNEDIPDESLDCIFIDGDHSYEAVKKDLAFWWNKLKKNGTLLGDDYYMGEVKRAVEEFANEIQQPTEFLTNNEQNRYKIYKFCK